MTPSSRAYRSWSCTWISRHLPLVVCILPRMSRPWLEFSASASKKFSAWCKTDAKVTPPAVPLLGCAAKSWPECLYWYVTLLQMLVPPIGLRWDLIGLCNLSTSYFRSQYERRQLQSALANSREECSFTSSRLPNLLGQTSRCGTVSVYPLLRWGRRNKSV